MHTCKQLLQAAAGGACDRALASLYALDGAPASLKRSEERRVGKECL